MNRSDPWRYRCPNGHTWITAHSMNDQHGPEAETKYRCRSCGWEGDRLIDQKTGLSAQAFADDVGFVSETGFSKTHDVIDRRINGLLLVHESALSDEALEIASEEPEEAPKA